MIGELRAGAYFSQMKRNQWLGPDELRGIAEKRLLGLLAHARENVPYYSRALEGIACRSLDDLPSIPVTGKKDVRAAPESFVSRTAQRLHAMRTSGSSGIPLQLYYDRSDSIYGFALRLHSFNECGFAHSDLLANLMVSKMPGHFLDRFLFRSKSIPPFEPERRKLELLSKFRPDIVLAYPSTFLAMASVNGPVRFRKAIAASEILAPNTRRAIEKSFSCSVRNYYGTNESWAIGWECERGRMHVNSDSVIVEILDDENQPAKRGNVVITSLWRRSMPFIRYNLGDISSLGGKCPCGRGLAVLGPIDGRASSVLRLPGGTLVSWANIQNRLKSLGGVMQFQGEQESPERLLIRVIPDGRGSPALASTIRELALSRLPERIGIRVEFVRSIGRNRSGKVPDFISALK